VKSKLAISTLAQKLNLSVNGADVEIGSVALASQLCEPGSLFIATQGLKHHGLDFLDQAISKGAVAVLSDRQIDSELPNMVHPDPKSIAGAIADLVYGTSESNMMLLGVTGTNGKTSTINYLHQILSALGLEAGMSASTSRVVGDTQLPAALTSPEVTELHQLLSQMRAAGAQHAAIEVSAQALIRHRVDSIMFKVVGFSNLSRDHLDDFVDMEHYLSAKAELFTPRFAQQGAVLVEDEWAKKLYEMSKIPVVGIGEGLEYQYRHQNGELSITGKQQLTVHFPQGALMAKNLVLALVILLEAGFAPERLTHALAVAKLHVPGRLELVSTAKPHVYVDYAHTPAGVASALAEIAKRYPKVTLVLGASGNRDQGKRAEMGLAAAAANLLIITDQHPRDEDPASIRHALLHSAGTRLDAGRILEIPDPEQAIKRAISETDADSAVLWCGPGHLTYREIRGQKVPFDARAIAREAVES
jgi:UDP-N-acetylmuramoyl-L-alanyl-D-glutamate--2,6-diaminopimelate ligase